MCLVVTGSHSHLTYIDSDIVRAGSRTKLCCAFRRKMLRQNMYSVTDAIIYRRLALALCKFGITRVERNDANPIKRMNTFPN